MRKPARTSPGWGSRSRFRVEDESAFPLLADEAPPAGSPRGDAPPTIRGCVLPQGPLDSSSSKPSSKSRLGPGALAGDDNGRGMLFDRSSAAQENCGELSSVEAVPEGRGSRAGSGTSQPASCGFVSTSSRLLNGFQPSRISRLESSRRRGSWDEPVMETLTTL